MKREYAARRKTKKYTARECGLVFARLAREGIEGWKGEHPDTLKFFADQCCMTLDQLAEEVSRVRRRKDAEGRAFDRYNQKHPWKW